MGPFADLYDWNGEVKKSQTVIRLKNINMRSYSTERLLFGCGRKWKTIFLDITCRIMGSEEARIGC